MSKSFQKYPILVFGCRTSEKGMLEILAPKNDVLSSLNMIIPFDEDTASILLYQILGNNKKRASIKKIKSCFQFIK